MFDPAIIAAIRKAVEPLSVKDRLWLYKWFVQDTYDDLFRLEREEQAARMAKEPVS